LILQLLNIINKKKKLKSKIKIKILNKNNFEKQNFEYNK